MIAVQSRHAWRIVRITACAVLGVSAPAMARAAPPSQVPWYDLPWLGAPKVVPPVVAAEREIGLTAQGMLGNYKEYPVNPISHDREIGWTPGVSLLGSSVFDIRRLHNLYAGIQGSVDTGDVAYHGDWSSRFGGYHGPFESRTNQQKASGQVELGKAWLLSRRLLLITAAQAGYGYWNRSIDSGFASAAGDVGVQTYIHGDDERYRYAWGGGVVHLDYAVTPRLVTKLIGAVGETFQGRMDSSTTPATFYLGDRPRLEGGAVLDYRMTSRWHLLADADYLHFGFGRSHDARAPGFETLYEPTSQTGELRLGVGVAFGF